MHSLIAKLKEAQRKGNSKAQAQEVMAQLAALRRETFRYDGTRKVGDSASCGNNSSSESGMSRRASMAGGEDGTSGRGGKWWPVSTC